MFYVLQVAPGTEDRTEALIRGRVESGVYSRCFHLLRHVRKKYRGEWKNVHEKLLPGYVFVTSGSAMGLYQELKRVPMLTKVLGRDGELFVALREGEVEWLEALLGLENGMEGDESNSGIQTNMAADMEDAVSADSCAIEVGLSQVLVENERVVILSGPLKNVEGRVRKYNLHKRVAEVEVEFMGRKTVIYLGVEIVERKE